MEVAGEPVSPRRKIAIGLVACAMTANLSYGIMWNSVVVALPHMQGEFAATTDQVTWVMIAFVLGSAMMTAVVGWLAARFGRRQVFITALSVFCVSLVGCGFSTSLEEIVFWRFVQGTSGAPLVPLTQVLVVNSFPQERQSQAMSFWALGFITSNVISPTMAGYIIEHVGWAWIFFAILPFAAMSLFASLFVVPDSAKTDEKLDWFGFLTLALGIGVLQVGLARGERLGWLESEEVLIELGIAILLLYWFLVHTITKPKTFMDKRLFRSWNFSLGVFMIFLIGAVLFLPMILMPLMLRDVGGYPADEIGELLFARGVGSIISLSLMAYLRERANPKLLMFIGLAVVAAPTWWMARWSVDVAPTQVMIANFIHGATAGFIWAPITMLTLGRLKGDLQDKGYAMFYLIFDVGSAIGTAIFISLWTHSAAVNRAWISESVTRFGDIWRQAPGIDIDRTQDLAMIADELTRQSSVIAFNNCFYAMGVTLLFLIPVMLFFKRPKPDEPEAT